MNFSNSSTNDLSDWEKELVKNLMETGSAWIHVDDPGVNRKGRKVTPREVDPTYYSLLPRYHDNPGRGYNPRYQEIIYEGEDPFPLLIRNN